MDAKVRIIIRTTNKMKRKMQKTTFFDGCGEMVKADRRSIIFTNKPSSENREFASKSSLRPENAKFGSLRIPLIMRRIRNFVKYSAA